MDNIGNRLYTIVKGAIGSLFRQGELAQLTYGAFDIAAKFMHESEQEEITVTYPVGYRPNRTAIESSRTYNKAELLSQYQYLAFNQLSINGVVQLVTTIEALLGDLIRALAMKFPAKLGGKRSIQLKAILESSSIEEIHMKAIDGFLNELSYKSPGEFAEASLEILSLNLLECPAFHRYVEIKATRDIYIHNRGIANEIYVRKAASHVRAKVGMQLPVDIHYFLESYESCLQLAEWLESKLHENWHSSDLEEERKGQKELPLQGGDQAGA